MKYLKLFESFEDIHQLCKKYGIENYSINNNSCIDVEEGVYLAEENLEKIPINFERVSGFFTCRDNQLVSLEGCPKEVGGYFECQFNKLTSLEFCPNDVSGNFNCCWNKLTSLEFCPNVGGGFNCSNNRLNSLKGCVVYISGQFDCKRNYLQSLEFCPEYVGDNFSCAHNNLKSLKFCPKYIGGNFHCIYNLLTVIDYLPKEINGAIYFQWNQIRDVKVGDETYYLKGPCYMSGQNPIDSLFKYWDNNLGEFIQDLEIDGFITNDGKSVDLIRLKNSLEFRGKVYKDGSISNYELI